MRHLRVILPFTLLLFSLACLKDNPLASPDTNAITLSINLPRGERPPDAGTGLSKAVAITSVTVTVTADDMEDIEESLDINGETASGTLKVPRGEDRTFTVECQDANGILQYSGSATQDILEKSETVEITTEGHYPSASTLTITSFDAASVALSWTENTDVDFASYELVRAGTADDLSSSSTRESIATITGKTTTTYADESVFLDTTYYYAIIVWDTEGMGMRSAHEGVKTPRWVELAYDDGDPYSGYYWSNAGQASLNLVTAPQPARLIATCYYLTDVSSGGAFYSLAFVYDGAGNLTSRGEKYVEATTTGWFVVSYLDSNIAVDGDFFVVMMYDGSNYPSFGYDLVDNSRAYDWDGENLIEWNETYFMRAIVEVPGRLLKEVKPSELVAFTGERPTLDPALLAPLLPRVDIPAKGTKVKTDR